MKIKGIRRSRKGCAAEQQSWEDELMVYEAHATRIAVTLAAR